jgi:hypothetical protein
VSRPNRARFTANAVGLGQIGPNRSVFPDPVKSFPDQRI